MEESQVSPKIECTLQRIESLIQRIRKTGDLRLLTEIVRIVIEAQRQR